VTPMILLTAAAFAGIGLALGLLHFHGLRGDTRRYLARGLRPAAVAAHAARLLATGSPLRFDQDARGITLHGLPAQPPDPVLAVIELVFDAVPRQQTLAVKIMNDVLGVDL